VPYRVVIVCNISQGDISADIIKLDYIWDPLKRWLFCDTGLGGFSKARCFFSFASVCNEVKIRHLISFDCGFEIINIDLSKRSKMR